MSSTVLQPNQNGICTGFTAHIAAPKINFGRSGKRYVIDQRKESNNKIYFENIRTALDIYLEEQGIKMVIFGPGETKRRFLNYLREKNESYQNKGIVIADGIETAGEDGIYVFLRSEAMKDLMSSSKIAMVSTILDRVMHA